MNDGMTQEVDVSRLRASFITNSPAPYRDQLYRELVERFAAVHVFYTEPASRDRSWPVDEGCPSERLHTVVSLGPAGAFQPGVYRAVREADVVFVGGYETFTYVLAMVLGRIMRRRVVLFFEGIAPSRLWRRGFRYWLKRGLVRLPHVSLVNGSVGRQYFEEVLGVSGQRIRNQFLVPNKATNSMPGGHRVDILFVGRLIERKGVDVLLGALRSTPELSAVIIGDGPLRPSLERAATGLNVRFLGELDRSEVDGWMQSAGCLVVPSKDEPWGLVVQEALQWNLPVVASNDVSSAHDLVRPGENGEMFHVGSPDGLAAAIRRASEVDRSRAESVNRQLLSTWSLRAHVDAFVLASSR